MTVPDNPGYPEPNAEYGRERGEQVMSDGAHGREIPNAEYVRPKYCCVCQMPAVARHPTEADICYCNAHRLPDDLPFRPLPQVDGVRAGYS